MPAPLPPVVDGPIYAVPGVQVYVDNVLPNALVKVLQAGAEVGHATSSAPGGIWVPTTVAVTAGKKITATQTYTGSASYIDATPGVSSSPSNVPITVENVPNPLPVPVFLSGVSQCSNSIWLGSLIPGCTIHVSQSGTTLVTAVIAQPTQWFTLGAPALVAGVAIQAFQTFEREISPTGSSLPVFPEPKSLSAPVLATPIRDCQTILDVSNVTPGANIEITNAGTDSFATSPWAAYTLVGLTPLQMGQVTAQQYFTKCQNVPKSPLAVFNVTNTPVPLPKVAYPLCANVNQFTVSDLIPGEILTLKRVVHTGSGDTVTDIGSQGVSSSTVTVNLPPGFSPTDPAGPVSIRLSVTLCGLETSAPPYITIPFATAAGPFLAPSVQSPLFACATVVTVLGAHPGSLIEVVSGAGALLANPVVATTANFVVNLWSPLVAGQKVSATQQGCNANGTSKPVTVLAIPNPLPVPVITTPVLTTASSVDVTGVIPGARVYLYVEGVYRSQVLATGNSASLPVGTPALIAQQFVEVTQAICTETSVREDAGPGYAIVYAPVPPPPQGLISNFNYFLEDGGAVLTGVTVTVKFTVNFVSTANGYSFQLNCYSKEGPGITTEWQQYVIYASPGSTQLVARIDTWNGTAAADELNRIDVNLANLPTPTIDAEYTLKFALTYTTDGTGTVTGCVYTATDNTGTVLGTTTITIVGQTLRTTGLPATAANLAPIVALQFNIGGDYGGSTATLSSGAGAITYAAVEPLGVVNTEPAYTDFNDGTAESANLTFGPLPNTSSKVVTQTFQVTGGSEPQISGRHVLGPPDNISRGRHVLGPPDELSRRGPAVP
jgi:hypothetical protein